MYEAIESEMRIAFEGAKQHVKTKFPMFANLVDEPQLEFVRDIEDGWDIRHSPSERKIKVNLFRVKWFLEREKQVRHCPKYDYETVLIHDLFEYCYFRYWNYPEDNQAVIALTHLRAKTVEDMARRQKGLSEWI